ncbi:hypothetical protein I3843_05G092900 [Carya illinoinensis]|uniref:Uncharacterized protein n=1 Tax=Carya illinoinensis TaxID=32201 RepID=A0A922JL06_CARIL|nr:hypothetical protein I3760_05G104000 [Carya illinoinensis]KAG6712371.1 hypothetical protein I3842_05G100000 [Carya illinoinensis]KAG7978656.1 hypothetical protein I3843_05G092900 [Carya illinoinensis]
MVERFFSVRQVELLDHNHSDPIMLLSGPPSCGKTSLLFQFAFNSAAGSNHEVVFICNRRKLESKPPYFSPGIDPSSDTFQRIQMKSCQEKYNNPRGRDLAMVRTLALCHNAIAHAKRVLASFSCPTHTMETLQGCSLSIRDGFQPFSLLKVMAWDRLF